MSADAFPLVDTHAHIFTRDMPLNDQPRHRPSYDFTREDYLAMLDKHGVRYRRDRRRKPVVWTTTTTSSSRCAAIRACAAR